MPEPRPIAELRQLHKEACTSHASFAISGQQCQTLIGYFTATARALPALLDCAEALDALKNHGDWPGGEHLRQAGCRALAALAAAGWRGRT